MLARGSEKYRESRIERIPCLNDTNTYLVCKDREEMLRLSPPAK